ncbi:MAG: PQQ-dependent sugar dehydrogenase [Chloroflexi bacterium]|nr:PQQ-dependent sugar dehydrogenase [Chloroflexota bacterium]
MSTKWIKSSVSDPSQTYAIPSSNPFAGRSDASPEVWAYGLRNPWRFSFDRATGDLYIADVGQNEYEEIDFQPAASAGGENYGWNSYEGLHTYNGGVEAGLTFPIAEYSHEEGGCSVSGGYVYRGPALPALSGVYFFGDYCSGKIWALYASTGGAWERMLMFDTEAGITSFGEDEAGEIYVVDGKGSIFQLAAVP